MRYLIALVVSAVLGCGANPRPTPPKPGPVERVLRFRSWGHVTHGYGIDPLTDDQARGRWHWVLRFRGDEVVEANEIAPSGAKIRHRELSLDSKGRLTVLEFDAHGTRKAVRTVDADGSELVVHNTGVVGDECHHRRLVPDKRGFVHESICFDEDDRPFPGESGCERVVHDRTDHGDIIHSACLRADGTRATFLSGQHEHRITAVDEVGSELEVVYIDLDGQPKATGCARAKSEYAKNGLVIRRRCTTKTGAFDAEAVWAYDDNGCQSAYGRIDADGKPILDNGVAGTLYVRNAFCEELRRETRGANGELVGRPAIREYERDRLGRMDTQRCRDANKAPINCIGGSSTVGALVKYRYDARDRQISKRCYTMAGTPSGCSADYPFDERIGYDERGRAIVVSYFDIDGNPALALGASRVLIDYDEVGNVAAKRYFGVHNEPVLTTLGCHELRSKRDEHHQLSSIECRGTAEELVAGSVCLGEACFVKGAARVVVERVTYTELFNVHYDASGKELARVSCDTAPCFR